MLANAKKVFLIALCCCLVACSTVTTTRVGVDYTPGSATNPPKQGLATVVLKSGETLEFQIFTVTPETLQGMTVRTRELRTIPWREVERIERNDVDGAKTALLAVGILAVLLLLVNSAVKGLASQLAPAAP
ncbi:MAG: hypothetical protein CFE44_22995 [Burkholderiales bacterium PBB4]|nr:MAG: hypothetical protein CFE44_22995 [Burkholderiales bacterium PBB4]